MRRNVRKEDYIYSQKRIGVDVARQGDDSSVLFPRQGLMAFKPVVMRNARNTDIASRVILAKNKWTSEVEYVDGTGGFGGGVIDVMIQRGFSPQEIHFSGKATDPRFANKRAEMYFRAAEWVKRGGSLPQDDDLLRELPVIEYTFDNKGRLLIEPKEDIKAKLSGASPDKSDAFVLTFADPEMMSGVGEIGLINRLEANESKAGLVASDWNPLDPDRI